MAKVSTQVKQVYVLLMQKSLYGNGTHADVVSSTAVRHFVINSLDTHLAYGVPSFPTDPLKT